MDLQYYGDHRWNCSWKLAIKFWEAEAISWCLTKATGVCDRRSSMEMYPPIANKNLGSVWTGPFWVFRKFSDITYEIRHETTDKMIITITAAVHYTDLTLVDLKIIILSQYSMFIWQGERHLMWYKNTNRTKWTINCCETLVHQTQKRIQYDSANWAHIDMILSYSVLISFRRRALYNENKNIQR